MKQVQVGSKHVGEFVRKASTVWDIEKDIAEGLHDLDRYEIEEVVVLSEKEMSEFQSNLFESREWLDGKGGTGSDYEIGREVEHIWELTKGELEEFRRLSFRKCIAVVSADEAYAVDSQGYDYARYIAKI